MCPIPCRPPITAVLSIILNFHQRQILDLHQRDQSVRSAIRCQYGSRQLNTPSDFVNRSKAGTSTSRCGWCGCWWWRRRTAAASRQTNLDKTLITPSRQIPSAYRALETRSTSLSARRPRVIRPRNVAPPPGHGHDISTTGENCDKLFVRGVSQTGEEARKHQWF